MMILDLHRQRHLPGGKVNIGIGISGASVPPGIDPVACGRTSGVPEKPAV
jgi:hypothetical protein